MVLILEMARPASAETLMPRWWAVFFGMAWHPAGKSDASDREAHTPDPTGRCRRSPFRIGERTNRTSRFVTVIEPRARRTVFMHDKRHQYILNVTEEKERGLAGCPWPYACGASDPTASDF